MDIHKKCEYATRIKAALETIGHERHVISENNATINAAWDRAYVASKQLEQALYDDRSAEMVQEATSIKLTVDEIIQEENSAAKLARLKEEVEIKQRLTELLDVCEMQQKEITRLKNENSVMRDWIRTAKATVLHAVQDLSQVGSMTHRDKDERILGVICTVMNVVNKSVMRHKSNMDDIPF